MPLVLAVLSVKAIVASENIASGLLVIHFQKPRESHGRKPCGCTIPIHPLDVWNCTAEELLPFHLRACEGDHVKSVLSIWWTRPFFVNVIQGLWGFVDMFLSVIRGPKLIMNIFCCLRKDWPGHSSVRAVVMNNLHGQVFLSFTLCYIYCIIYTHWVE